MPAYLVTDSVTGDVVMVDAARSRGAIKAVVDNRFSACELDWREVFALAKKNVRLIDAATGQSEDEDTDPDPAETPPAAVEQPESPGESVEGLAAGETAESERLLERMAHLARQSEPEAHNG